VYNNPRSQDTNLPVPTPGHLPALRDPAEDWQVLGDTFEALGKAGLAMTVGFSVAAVFCKLVDNGKIKLPNLISLMAASQAEPKAPEARNSAN